MPTLPYHLLNVFAEQRLAGNPLAVFAQAELDTPTMQAIAHQLNLAETVFLQPASDADASLRIFTPYSELPFAGHPLLGAAMVLGQQLQRSQLRLRTGSGVLEAHAADGRWWFTANAPKYRPSRASPGELASMLGLSQSQLLPGIEFVDTGLEQLMVPVSSRGAVLSCSPFPTLLRFAAASSRQAPQVAVWHREGNTVTLRFFSEINGQLFEDHGTGSACANLGGWLLRHGVVPPLRLRIEQGMIINRLSVLELALTGSGLIEVGGRVLAVGRGELWL